MTVCLLGDLRLQNSFSSVYNVTLLSFLFTPVDLPVNRLPRFFRQVFPNGLTFQSVLQLVLSTMRSVFSKETVIFNTNVM